MKKKIGGIGLCMLAWSILTCAQTITPQAEQRAREIVSKMTLQEKIEYISGYTSFSLRAIPRLGIPEIKLADGPQGIRNHAPKSLSILPEYFPLLPGTGVCFINWGKDWDRMPKPEE